MSASKNSFVVAYFNPRSPCGERLALRQLRPGGAVFQSTLPLRGATVVPHRIAIHKLISIHAPLAGSDSHNTLCFPHLHKFQSTLPLRGATLA